MVIQLSFKNQSLVPFVQSDHQSFSHTVSKIIITELGVWRATMLVRIFVLKFSGMTVADPGFPRWGVGG